MQPRLDLSAATRLSARAIAIVTLVTAIGLGPAHAEDPSLVPTSLSVGTFAVRGMHIDVNASGGTVVDPYESACVFGSWLRTSATRRIEGYLEGCSRGAPVAYHFDPITWVGDVWARVPVAINWTVYDTTTRQEMRRRTGRSSVVLRLTWTGTGVPLPRVIGGCSYPCIGGVGYPRIERTAVVSGWLRFEHLGVRARTPEPLEGLMRIW